MPNMMLDLRALTLEQRGELMRDLDRILEKQAALEALEINLVPFVNRLIRLVGEAREYGRELLEMAVMESGAIDVELVREHADYLREFTELQRLLRVSLVLYPGMTRSVDGTLRPDARVRVYLLPEWQVPPVAQWGTGDRF